MKDFRLDILQCDSIEAIKEALFSCLGRYRDVFPESKSAKILIKPNLNSNMNALTGNTTDLRILSALIEFLKDKNFKDITIGEGTNSGYYRNRIGVINRLMIDKLAAHYGVQIKDLNYSEPHAIEFEDGVTAMVARECVEADLLINVPKLKTHFETGMSVCLKSLIGCLAGQENKKKTHLSLAANILRINRAVKPHLHIVDGLVAMQGLGPTRGTPLRMDTIIMGTDPFLIDLCCARIAKFDYKKVSTLNLAEEKGLLTAEHHQRIDSLDLKGFQTEFEPPKPGLLAGFIHHPQRQQFFLAIRNTPLFNYLASTNWFGKLLFLSGLRQDVFLKDELTCTSIHVDDEMCENCGVCQDICPLGTNPAEQLKSADNTCIHCLYCYMACPAKAVKFAGQLGFLEEQFRQYDEQIREMYRNK